MLKGDRVEKAVLSFEPCFNMLSFRYKDIYIISGIPLNLKEIYGITKYSDNVITIQTNIGEKYLDFLCHAENRGCSEKWIDRAKNELKELKLEDIELRVLN